MPRRCTICIHRDGSAISRDLGHHVSLREIATRYGVALCTVQRHAVGCLNIRRRAGNDLKTPAEMRERTKASEVFRPTIARPPKGETLAARSAPEDELPATIANEDDFVRHLEFLLARHYGLMDRARDRNDLRAEIQAVRESANTLERLARHKGYIQPEGGAPQDNRTLNIFAGRSREELEQIIAALRALGAAEAPND